MDDKPDTLSDDSVAAVGKYMANMDLTDDELISALAFFTDLSRRLDCLGKDYHLATWAATGSCLGLLRMAHARDPDVQRRAAEVTSGGLR